MSGIQNRFVNIRIILIAAIIAYLVSFAPWYFLRLPNSSWGSWVTTEGAWFWNGQVLKLLGS